MSCLATNLHGLKYKVASTSSELEHVEINASFRQIALISIIAFAPKENYPMQIVIENIFLHSHTKQNVFLLFRCFSRAHSKRRGKYYLLLLKQWRRGFGASIQQELAVICG